MSFEKTMLMSKEEQNDGTFRYYRIPWDLVSYDEFSGLMPVSILSRFNNRLATTVYTSNIESDLLKMQDNPVPNEISAIEYFDSEQEFLDIFDNVTMYYETDSGQSGEAGYPRT